MAIAEEAQIQFMNLGVRGVVPGDPDGFFSLEHNETGDASGGTITVLAVLGPSGPPSHPVDIMMRCNYLQMHNAHSAVVPNARVGIVLGMPFSPAAGGQLTEFLTPSDNDDDLGVRSAMVHEFQNGLWTLSQKDSRFYATFICDNINTAVMTFSLQGFYWYMGRKRRAMPTL